MSGARLQRRGASWVHALSPDDTPATFTHTMCGLGFTSQQVRVLPEDTAITCPSCQEQGVALARARIVERAPAPREFRPKTGEIALAWAGPRVEVCTTIVDSSVRTVVFLDGLEVPFGRVSEHVVDPAIGWTDEEWQRVTGDVTGDTSLSPAFRHLVVTERDTVRDVDGGRNIVRAARHG